MRKAEPVDEFAETEVLIDAEGPMSRDAEALSLYAEYENELAHEAKPRVDARVRR